MRCAPGSAVNLEAEQLLKVCPWLLALFSPRTNDGSFVSQCSNIDGRGYVSIPGGQNHNIQIYIYQQSRIEFTSEGVAVVIVAILVTVLAYYFFAT